MYLSELHKMVEANPGIYELNSCNFTRFASGLIPAVSGVGLECRLNKLSQSPIDFCVRFIKSAGEFDVLEKLCDQEITIGGNEPGKKWQFIKEIARVCSTHKMFGAIDVLWLEFDEQEVNDSLPFPALFFNVPSCFQCNFQNIIGLLTLIDKNLFSENQYRNLEKLSDYMIKPYKKTFVGLFLSRMHHPVRLTIKIKYSALEKVITDLNCGEISNDLKIILHEISGYIADEIVVNLNIGDEIDIWGGIEIKAKNGNYWRSILSKLEENNWCDTESQNTAIQWPASHPQLNNTDVCNRLSLKMPNKENIECYYVRRINHIKLQIKDEIKKVAKIYLYEGYVYC